MAVVKQPAGHEGNLLPGDYFFNWQSRADRTDDRPSDNQSAGS